MRISRRILISLVVTAGLLLTGVWLLSGRPERQPKVIVTITGVTQVGTNWLVTTAVTNAGKTVFLSDAGTLGVLVGENWTNLHGSRSFGNNGAFFDARNWMTNSFIVSTKAARIRAEWQMASATGPKWKWMAFLLKHGLWNRFYPASQWVTGLLPTGTIEPCEFQSPEMELPMPTIPDGSRK